MTWGSEKYLYLNYMENYKENNMENYCLGISLLTFTTFIFFQLFLSDHHSLQQEVMYSFQVAYGEQ